MDSLDNIPERLLLYYKNKARESFHDKFPNINKQHDLYEFALKLYILAYIDGVQETYRVFWQNVRDNRDRQIL